MSITNYMEKIKRFLNSEQGKDIMIVLIVILVGLGSFELGRLSKGGSNSGIKVQYQAGSVPEAVNNAISAISSNTDNSTTSATKTFFASSKGTKYYSISCSGGIALKYFFLS